MQTNNGFTKLTIVPLTILTTVLIISGCNTLSVGPTANDATADSSGTIDSHLASAQGGAQMWIENCTRCHNLRPPRMRSDREWDIILHHMRVRANLTAEEHRQILDFVQAAN